MQDPIWTFDDLVLASGGEVDGQASGDVTGVSIDTRTLQGGDVFVALKDQRDGHEFVSNAFEKGAACAVVSKSYARGDKDGVLVRVSDPYVALCDIAVAARARLPDSARIVAVTGSAGKTSTKDMLRLVLSQCGSTHSAEKSYNNHLGVPLTLARMPASADYGVFEIGMNHSGEISPLAKLVRPHVVIITTVAPVHLAFFDSVEDIARAKAEIFDGLEAGGSAVLNQDNEHFCLLAELAKKVGAEVVGYGHNKDAAAKIVEVKSTFDNTHVRVSLEGEEVSYKLTTPGDHLMMNSLSVLEAVKRLGGDVTRCASVLSDFEVPEGRGERLYVTCGGGQTLVIDESYNANPASVRAALSILKLLEDGVAARRIAVLGDMLELGDDSEQLHRELKEPVLESKVDLVFACGPHMSKLMDALPENIRGGYAPTAEELEPVVVDAIGAGDVVVVKGSLGSRMGGIVRALKIQLANRPTAG